MRFEARTPAITCTSTSMYLYLYMYYSIDLRKVCIGSLSHVHVRLYVVTLKLVTLSAVVLPLPCTQAVNADTWLSVAEHVSVSTVIASTVTTSADVTAYRVRRHGHGWRVSAVLGFF